MGNPAQTGATVVHYKIYIYIFDEFLITADSWHLCSEKFKNTLLSETI